MYSAIVFAPLIGALITGFGGRRLGDKASGVLTSTLLVFSALLSWVALYKVGLHGETGTYKVLNWVNSGDLQTSWAFRIDTLTAVMLVVVNSVSSLVHIYSIGYMSHDPHQPRFFAYLSLFTFAMLMLITSDNFLQMFFGWEGVGLASYLLIGFWYKKPSACAAAIKAFVVNRIGDFGFALGIFAIYMVFGSIEFDTVFAAANAQVGKTFTFPQLAGGYYDHHLSVAVYGRHGQISPVFPAYLVARCDGRSNTCISSHSCRHHGHRRCLPGGALFTIV